MIFICLVLGLFSFVVANAINRKSQQLINIDQKVKIKALILKWRIISFGVIIPIIPLYAIPTDPEFTELLALIFILLYVIISNLIFYLILKKR